MVAESPEDGWQHGSHDAAECLWFRLRAGGKGFYLREPEQSIIPAKRNIILLLAGDGRTNGKKIIILMEPNRKSVNVGDASMPEASERMARQERGGFINERISYSSCPAK